MYMYIYIWLDISIFIPFADGTVEKRSGESARVDVGVKKRGRGEEGEFAMRAD